MDFRKKLNRYTIFLELTFVNARNVELNLCQFDLGCVLLQLVRKTKLVDYVYLIRYKSFSTKRLSKKAKIVSKKLSGKIFYIRSSDATLAFLLPFRKESCSFLAFTGLNFVLLRLQLANVTKSEHSISSR